VKTSGNIRYVRLESGGYALAYAWWVEDDSLAGCAARLPDGSAELSQAGRLTLFPGFHIDGGSGPAQDTRNGMEGYTAHDGLYRLGRRGSIPRAWRQRADALMFKLHRLNGMSWLRAKAQYVAVRMFGGVAFRYEPDPEQDVKTA
jgi:hypothetical protein